MIRVLCLLDGPEQRARLLPRLQAVPAFEFVDATAPAGEIGSLLAEMRPQVLLLGWRPGGGAARRLIMSVMQDCPLPIVVLGPGREPAQSPSAGALLDEGALAVSPDPSLEGARVEALNELIGILRAMAEVRVVRRRGPGRAARRAQAGPPARIVLIGASTGGPAALRCLLAELGRDFSLPVVIVQHMAAGFSAGFAGWLQAASGYPVELARDRQPLRAGRAYVVPEGVQPSVSRSLRLHLVPGAHEHGMAPSVSHLFREGALQFGAEAAAVLLTGMGRDGAFELGQLRQAGACTIAQDRASCAVFGMPGEAIRLGAARHVLPPAEIGRLLVGLARVARTS